MCAKCSVLCQENLSKQFAFSRTFFYYFYIYFLNIFYNVLGYLLKKMQVILCIVSVFLGQFAFLSGRCASCSGVGAALGSVSFASLSWPGREGGDQPSSLWVPLFESFRVSLKLDSSRMGDLVFNVVYLFTKNLVDAARQLRIFSTNGKSMVLYICIMQHRSFMFDRYIDDDGKKMVLKRRNPQGPICPVPSQQCQLSWSCTMPGKVGF